MDLHLLATDRCPNQFTITYHLVLNYLNLVSGQLSKVVLENDEASGHLSITDIKAKFLRTALGSE